jgi:DNA-binding NtrC family response regulator
MTSIAVADVDATNFIKESKASKEAFKTATLLRTLKVNALIKGQSGVGKKTLARYILPNAPLIDAKNYEELLSVLQSSKEVIITHIENVSNIKVILDIIKSKDIKVVATSSVSFENKIADEFFGIVLDIPPLEKRPEDTKALIDKFLEEAKEILGYEINLDKDNFFIDLSKNGYSLKKGVIIASLLNEINENEIMKILYGYFYKRLEGDEKYKKFLHLYEAPLIKAGLNRYNSQLQLSKVLGLNRNTLRKKIHQIKEYLDE